MYRRLDGVYFRVQNDGVYNDICFSDLTDEQQKEVMEGKSEEWLKSLCQRLACVIKEIGDQFDLIAG